MTQWNTSNRDKRKAEKEALRLMNDRSSKAYCSLKEPAKQAGASFGNLAQSLGAFQKQIERAGKPIRLVI